MPKKKKTEKEPEVNVVKEDAPPTPEIADLATIKMLDPLKKGVKKLEKDLKEFSKTSVGAIDELRALTKSELSKHHASIVAQETRANTIDEAILKISKRLDKLERDGRIDGRPVFGMPVRPKTPVFGVRASTLRPERPARKDTEGDS